LHNLSAPEVSLALSLNIGIVGGSLAGCAASILLRRAGHQVTVYEHTTGSLEGRGGGIGTTGTVLSALMRNDVVDADFPHCSAGTMPFVGKHAEHEPGGRSPWSMPLDLQTFRWSALWQTLRSRVPDEHYHAGSPVASAEMVGSDAVRLRTEEGTEEKFDLLLFADGAQSYGRSMLFPDAELRYRGYFLWRGMLGEGSIKDSTPLENAVPRLSHLRQPGNTVMYFIPGEDGDSSPGARACHWSVYLPLRETEIPQFMVDRIGQRLEGMIPPGSMRPEVEAQLKQTVQDNLPGYYADIITQTTDTSAHLIYTADVPSYYRGRMCLIGDAGAVIQPFTGSGIFKGYNNVRSLLDTLEVTGDTDRALRQWDAMQVVMGRRLLALGDQMEQAFIWNPLDLSTADAAAAQAWWNASVRFPDDFTMRKS
jgi:2-polyprenyl-6-methoxyphenol hydroxylase-like FAD-dependent oxidoreductase